MPKALHVSFALQGFQSFYLYFMIYITKFSKYISSNRLLSINEDGIYYVDNTYYSIDHRLFFQLH